MVKTLFSPSLNRSTRSPFQHFFSSTNYPVLTKKSHKFSQFYIQNALFWQISVPNSKIRPKSSSGSLNMGQRSVLKAAFCQKISSRSLKFGADPFYKLPFSTLMIPKPKLSISMGVRLTVFFFQFATVLRFW